MSTLPTCTEENTILEAALIEKAIAGDVVMLVLCPMDPKVGCYVVAHLRDDPKKPVYLATRRVRTEPKLFIDQSRLTRNLLSKFKGIPITVRLPQA